MDTLAPAPVTTPDPDRAAPPYFAPDPARYPLMLAEEDRCLARRAQSPAA